MIQDLTIKVLSQDGDIIEGAGTHTSVQKMCGPTFADFFRNNPGVAARVTFQDTDGNLTHIYKYSDGTMSVRHGYED